MFLMLSPPQKRKKIKQTKETCKYTNQLTRKTEVGITFIISDQLHLFIQGTDRSKQLWLTAKHKHYKQVSGKNNILNYHISFSKHSLIYDITAYFHPQSKLHVNSRVVLTVAQEPQH